MNVASVILFVLVSTDFTDLGIVDSTHGFNFTVPKNRSDIMGLELCFMPRTEPTNAPVSMTLSKAQAENMTMTGDTIPDGVQDGRVVLGMRWVLTSGRKGKWRLGAFDLWRNEPEPPSATQTFVSERGVESRHAPDVNGHGQDVRTREAASQTGSQDSAIPIVQPEVGVASDRSETLTNDAPVRAWHGAMQAVVKVKESLTPDPELARAIAEHFNRPANPPPMPPSTNTNESASRLASPPIEWFQIYAEGQTNLDLKFTNIWTMRFTNQDMTPFPFLDTNLAMTVSNAIGSSPRIEWKLQNFRISVHPPYRETNAAQRAMLEFYKHGPKR